MSISNDCSLLHPNTVTSAWSHQRRMKNSKNAKYPPTPKPYITPQSTTQNHDRRRTTLDRPTDRQGTLKPTINQINKLPTNLDRSTDQTVCTPHMQPIIGEGGEWGRRRISPHCGDCGSRGDGRAGDAVGISGEEQGTRWGGGFPGDFSGNPRHGDRFPANGAPEWLWWQVASRFGPTCCPRWVFFPSQLLC